MTARSNSARVCSIVLTWLVGSLATATVLAWGQVEEKSLPDSTSKATTLGADYAIGAGDIINVAVLGAPELGGKFRVTESGYLTLPGMAAPLKAEGLTPFELSQKLGDALKAAELLQNPIVTVFVDQFHGSEVTVFGAVARPSVYPLSKPTSLLQLLSMAGGVLPSAGKEVTITRKKEEQKQEGLSETSEGALSPPSTMKINVAQLIEGKDPSLDIQVHAGDVIDVATAPVFYVVGAVNRPGGFVLQDAKYGLTVLKAMGLAGGVSQNAAASRSLIIRRSREGGEDQGIPIDLRKLMAGKIADQPLQENDILFVPESSMKKGVAALMRTGQAAATSLLIYTGYQVIR